MPLYQSVRPKKLDEIVGNSAAIGALRKMLRSPLEKRPHAILLKGPTGCGKTTIARILAREFGSVDQSIFELNAANTRGIDTVREISSCAPLRALEGLTKTYIFDESHQFTPSAQQALLKIIEDSPSHCYFIFCSTEPQNLIKTVRNRCTEYEVSLLSMANIVKVLTAACSKEGIEVSGDILEGISYVCEGSPRAALVSLEQVRDIDSVDEALEVLVRGTERDTNVIDLCKLLVMDPQKRQGNWKRIIDVFSGISEDSERVRHALLTLLLQRLRRADDVSDAENIAYLLKVFSQSTFYGGKSQLGALVAGACFGL